MKTPNKSVSSSSRRKSTAALNQQLGIPLGTVEIVSCAIRESGLTYDAYVRTITASALSDLEVWSQSDLERLLLEAQTHRLNPLNREIFMLSNAAGSPPLIAVGVDGWAKIMNAHPQFAGMMFCESPEQSNGIPLWIECEIHRHDRVVPLKVREYFEESRSEHLAWITHPRRMLRHKCMVQCARLAFGLSGICDSDEALRIKESKRTSNSTLHKARHVTPKGIAALAQSLEGVSQSP
ncbi:hypothetical protein B9Z35_06085 [Limnohabitans sp. Jir61]|uniref:recombinase RecT n=1 Tax=Limnohabitans sp. Jir61 TaxID=1826168 RepID=UPI000D3520E5|nr:hypothetical protein B9Z35_06085 [Limnohabitans sp. Jir61]